MVRIFDLPPGGLVDGATATEVNADGSPVESVPAEEVNPVPTENSQILRKEFINKQNDKERDIIVGGETRDIFKKDSKKSHWSCIVKNNLAFMAINWTVSSFNYY